MKEQTLHVKIRSLEKTALCKYTKGVETMGDLRQYLARLFMLDPERLIFHHMSDYKHPLGKDHGYADSHRIWFPDGAEIKIRTNEICASCGDELCHPIWLPCAHEICYDCLVNSKGRQLIHSCDTCFTPIGHYKKVIEDYGTETKLWDRVRSPKIGGSLTGSVLSLEPHVTSQEDLLNAVAKLTRSPLYRDTDAILCAVEPSSVEEESENRTAMPIIEIKKDMYGGVHESLANGTPWAGLVETKRQSVVSVDESKREVPLPTVIDHYVKTITQDKATRMKRLSSKGIDEKIEHILNHDIIEDELIKTYSIDLLRAALRETSTRHMEAEYCIKFMIQYITDVDPQSYDVYTQAAKDVAHYTKKHELLAGAVAVKRLAELSTSVTP